MNLLKSIIILLGITISVSSCVVRRGYDRPLNPRLRYGWHRGGGYGHGAGSYRPAHRVKNYKHYN